MNFASWIRYLGRIALGHVVLEHFHAVSRAHAFTRDGVIEACYFGEKGPPELPADRDQLFRRAYIAADIVCG